MTTDQLCAHCTKSIDDERWVRLDGEFYHSVCWPRRTPTNHDAAANIVRLTGQVATLQAALTASESQIACRNELHAALRKSDAQRNELQAMLTACEERETQQRERAKKAEGERDEHYRKLTNYWATYGGCSDAAGEKFVAEKETLRERAKKLEEALRYVRNHTALIWMHEHIDAALAPAPPAEMCNCAGPNSTNGKYCINCKRPIAQSSPAETPAPTCKCIGPEHCCVYFPMNCGEHYVAPVDRDASAEPPAPTIRMLTVPIITSDAEVDSRVARLVTQATAQKTETPLEVGRDASVETLVDATIDRLRAELAAANETIARLRWCDKHAVAQPCQHCPDERIVAKLGEETMLRSQMQARLGQAVTALRGVVEESDRSTPAYEEAHSILADSDADSAAAGEAWQATKMVVQAARRHRDTDAVLDAFYVRLDAVDARRERSK